MHAYTSLLYPYYYRNKPPTPSLSPDMPSPVRLVIAGAGGFIGLRHIDNVLLNPDLSLVAIVEPGPNGPSLGEKLAIPHFTTVEDLLASGIELDAALVATPNATHVPISVPFLRKGIHCLIEKPISIDSESALEIIKAAREGNARVMIGVSRIQYSRNVQIKTKVDNAAPPPLQPLDTSSERAARLGQARQGLSSDSSLGHSEARRVLLASSLEAEVQVRWSSERSCHFLPSSS